MKKTTKKWLRLMRSGCWNFGAYQVEKSAGSWFIHKSVGDKNKIVDHFSTLEKCDLYIKIEVLRSQLLGGRITAKDFIRGIKNYLN